MKQCEVSWEEARQIMLRGGWCRYEGWGERVYAYYSKSAGYQDYYRIKWLTHEGTFDLKDSMLTGKWYVVKEPPEPMPSVKEDIDDLLKSLEELSSHADNYMMPVGVYKIMRLKEGINRIKVNLTELIHRLKLEPDKPIEPPEPSCEERLKRAVELFEVYIGRLAVPATMFTGIDKLSLYCFDQKVKDFLAHEDKIREAEDETA